MQNGDLVKMVEFFHPEDTTEGIAERKKWERPGVIIKGPYEAQIDHAGPSGKIRYVELIKAVDIMMGVDVVRRVPIKYLRRVNEIL